MCVCAFMYRGVGFALSFDAALRRGKAVPLPLQFMQLV